MKRIKDRWDSEYPEKRRTGQNIVDSICRFAKEGWRAEISRNQITEMQKSTDWNTKMKISIIIIDEKTANFSHIY